MKIFFPIIQLHHWIVRDASAIASQPITEIIVSREVSLVAVYCNVDAGFACKELD